MAGRLRKFTAHGAFNKKSDAKKKERKVGGFIRRVSIKGHRRFLVLKKRGR